MIRRYALQVSLLALLFALCSRPLRADCVDNSVISLFPRNISEFACVNLDDAKQLPWFADFKGQVLPKELYGFNPFLASAGIDPNTQVSQVAWAIGASAPNSRNPSDATPDSDQFLAVMVGHFDADSAKSALEARALATVQVGDFTLYPIASGAGGPSFYFILIDSDKAAFGQLAMLEQLIAVEQGSSDSLLSNVPMLALVEGVNDATFWGVFNGSGTRQAIRQLAPSAAKFTESAKLFHDVKSLVMSATASASDVDFHVQISTDSLEDSVMLSQILQAAFVVQKYSAKQSNPTLTALLEDVSVAPNGNLVTVSVAASDDQLRALILQRAFSPGM